MGPGTDPSWHFLSMGTFHAKQSIRERVGDEPRSQSPEQAHIDMLHELSAPRVNHMRGFMLRETTTDLLVRV
ncbi:MAG: hypothetical protein A4C66_14750 [Nitrospira sp. HN-bin3]|nr:MAG: hypothetical protein A4C66_14750 [Nitrospira sp. HN-bin3]